MGNEQEISPHTGQREPIEHRDGRTGIIWRCESVSSKYLSVKWDDDDGTIERIKWEDLQG